MLVLAVSLGLVACGGSSDNTTSASSLAGTYKGNVTGVNAGPMTIIVSSDNVVTGTFDITNRGDDGMGSYVTTMTGSVDSAGKFKADGNFRGLNAMQFNGVINTSTGVLSGTWFEYEFPEKGGAFSLQK